ncbi:uncharacterized protein LOC119110358 isoform X2 [Pollicipes pollicipes]|uniref:uncharacterized protein LOC119110358 isoform X2 n=1 Tax=Pollicipes pollicipes TaxID=41117 RepID=UPI001885402B|nr:uncharacterized protein LOC119110358 isoform X2 [Pollicipes pollicipes]
MCLADLDTVRQARHSCAALGSLMQFFYLAAAVMLACEGYANFRSVIEGSVNGKYRAYVAFTWGIPSLVVGYTLLTQLEQLGDDPRCVIGWRAHLKVRTLLAPLLLAMGVALVGASVARCNARHARARSELLFDQLSVCAGHGWFTLLHTVTWVLGMVSYVTLAGDDSQVAGIVYSLFQALSAMQGVFFFLLMGSMSNRFHAALPCTKHRHRESGQNSQPPAADDAEATLTPADSSRSAPERPDSVRLDYSTLPSRPVSSWSRRAGPLPPDDAEETKWLSSWLRISG